MLTKDRRTLSTHDPDPGRAPGRTVLHRGAATVDVRYVGPDCVSVVVTTRPAAARTAAAPDDPTGDPGEPTHVNPYVRAVLDAAASSPNRLLDALGERLGTEVAGVSLDRRADHALVTIDLLPTRRPGSSWPRAGWSAGARSTAARRTPQAATA